MRWQEIRSKFDSLKGKRDYLETKLASCEELIKENEKKILDITKARWVITEVAEKTQSFFVEQTESLVTSAIKAVFDRPFRFKMNLQRKRNRIECSFLIKENDAEYVPKDEMGGGIIDVLSFALRVVFWSLSHPRTRPIFVLDEPMKYVGKGELLDRAGKMIKEISNKLGIQMVVVTHEPQLAEIADRAWQIEHDGEKSRVKIIDKQTQQIEKKLKRRRIK